MSLNLAQSLLSSPRAVCYVGDAKHPRGHVLRETVTPSARLLLLTKGKLAYHYPTGEVQYRKGDLWLVPQLTRRRWQVVSASVRMLWVEFVHLLPIHDHISTHAMRAEDLDHALFDRVIGCWSTNDSTRLLEINSLLQTLLVRYALAVDSDVHNTASGRHPSIGKVLKWLSTNFEKADVIDGLHEQANLSANHFRKVFKQATDMSPTQYVQMLRLRKARFLLLTTDKSVQEVGFMVAYADPMHFSRQYRQCWGISPKQDRASAQ
ncbi:MAG: helix-turn-helix domain-containing protein [Phycisphaeraceae bacterium JB051]